MSDSKLATTTVRAGIGKDQHHGAVVQPLHLSSTFSLKGFNQKRDFDYARSGNPNRSTLAQLLAELEQGSTGIVTSSGMSAVHLVCQLLSVDDTLVVPHDCYGGSYRLFTHLADRGLFKLIVVDQSDEQALAQALATNPKLVLVETPSNPLLRVVDIQAISDKAHQAGALVVADNTFLTPVWQQPLTLGADIVLHSTTKYLNGHSDMIGGAVVVKDTELGEKLTWWANCIGVTGGAFDSFLAVRGLKTLKVRMAAHEQNTAALIELLNSHDAVAKVYYPGLANHPDHALAARQQKSFGAMVSFDLAGGIEAVKAFVESTQLFTLAQSLGGVESLSNHPATMTHASMDEAAQLKAGISQSLIRLSVGIEDIEDLRADLAQALNAALHCASNQGEQ